MSTSTSLTSGRLLARNTVWNLAASGASILIALFSVPILLRYLGADRFGVISLVWVVEGQFSVFDLGLSQALTKLVAERLAASREEEIPAIFWGSLLIMGALGLAGAVILRAVSPWLVHSALKVPLAIQPETLTSFHLVAISLPVVISSAALRGFLAANQRFDILSAVRVPISLFSYLVPLAVLPFSKKLGPFILVLVAARFIAWLTHLILCFRVSPALRRRITIANAPFGHMFRFGGWMTVTNIISPIMVSLDRILIGVLVSMAAVAYYATPYEVATKLWIIPSAISGVLFPAFAATLLQDKPRAAMLFERAVNYIFLALFPVVIAVLTLGHLGLHLWLGPLMAAKCTLILKFLILGVFANSLAQIPFWLIQAANRPDLAAKVHFVELPVYLLLFWGLTRTYGITGAGIAWMLRTTVDSAVMFWFSGQLLFEIRPALRRLLKMSLLAAPIFLATFLIENNAIGALFLVASCLLILLVSWFRLLSPEERDLARNPGRLLSALQYRTR